MKKIIAIFALMLFTLGSVNAGSCDMNGDGVVDLTDTVYLAQVTGWLRDHDLRADLNNDGIVNLVDISMFSQGMQEEGWCHENFWDLLNDEEVEESAPWTSGHSTSFKENLDKKDEITMARNSGSISRMILFNKIFYKVGFIHGIVTLHDRDNIQQEWPEGLEVKVEPRTEYSRFLKFFRSEE